MNRLILYTFLITFITFSCKDSNTPKIFNIEKLDKRLDANVNIDLKLLRKKMNLIYSSSFSEDSLLNKLAIFADASDIEKVFIKPESSNNLENIINSNKDSKKILNIIFECLDDTPCLKEDNAICIIRDSIELEYPQKLYVGNMLSGMLFLNFIGELRKEKILNNDELNSLLILWYIVMKVEYNK